MQFSRRHFLSTAALAGAGSGLAVQAAAAKPQPDGRLNILDAGVIADSAQDQSVAFQRAIDLASLNGRTLVVPPGVYRVGSLRVASPLVIEGTPGQTVLKYTGAGTFLRVQDAEHVNLRGLTFDGDRLSVEDAMVDASGCANLVVDNCRFTDSAVSGLALNRCSGRVAASDFSGMAEAALFSLDAQGLEITGNTVRDCANNGILVWRSAPGEDGTLVTGNRIERIAAQDGGSGQNGNGVNIFRAWNVIVSGNRISDCAFSAVRANAGSGCQITSNTCTRLGEVALYAEFAFEGAIIANNLVHDAAAGISITNFNEGGRLAVCANNIVRDLHIRPNEEDMRGIGISVEADTVVEGNVVENAPMIGIALGWGRYLRDVTATGNVVRKCGIGIGVQVAEGAGTALVSNNMISGSDTAAVAGMEHLQLVVRDLEKPTAEMPANVVVQGNLAS